jgi:hypothetical protein
MPKVTIDYSNTVIYKIYCKDNSVKDLYVGHTTNFTKRKHQHKLCCNNGQILHIYNIIRANGGWDNWDMIEIEKYNCKDVVEARIKENEHYTLLNASLNSVPPYVDKSNLFCSVCSLQCNSQKLFEKHIKCGKHEKKYNIQKQNNEITSDKKEIIQKENATPKKKEINTKLLKCEKCKFKCFKKSDWQRHISSIKHSSKTNFDILEQKSAENLHKKISETFNCKFCKKIYYARNSLWYHEKKCNSKSSDFVLNNNNDNINEIKHVTNLVIEIIKNNSELQKNIFAIYKQLQSVTIDKK